ncbi:hypothetical protein AC1031_014403 [Aphanomyces cochlioides]|nr:hypothetical protein AC1031_014403 [Aphanomyces cochlioides]
MLPSEAAMHGVQLELNVALLLLDTSFWGKVNDMNKLLHSICSCLGYLESDQAPLSSVYACMLFLKCALKSLVGGTNLDLNYEQLIGALHKRFDSIYSPCHSLLFVTDPLFFHYRQTLKSKHGVELVGFKKGSLQSQCTQALLQCAHGNDDKHGNLVADLARFLASNTASSHTFHAAPTLLPHLHWSLLQSEYVYLAPLLTQLHSNPCGAVGGERNHKVGKHVHSTARSSLRASSVQMQVAVMFNQSQLSRELVHSRRDKILYEMLSFVSSSDPALLALKTCNEQTSETQNNDDAIDVQDSVDEFDGLENALERADHDCNDGISQEESSA